MKICEINWMQVEEHLKRDDRAVVPLGSTEQHAYLSLCTDSILSETVSVAGVAVPISARLIALIHDIENGTRYLSTDNRDLLIEVMS